METLIDGKRTQIDEEKAQRTAAEDQKEQERLERKADLKRRSAEMDEQKDVSWNESKIQKHIAAESKQRQVVIEAYVVTPQNGTQNDSDY